MSASQIRHSGYYDTRPAYPAFGGANGSVNAIRKFSQGAGAAVLMFSGADSLANGPQASASGAQPVMDISSLNGIAESLATGGLNGPMQIAGAALIFMLAGKSTARILGLIAAAVLIVMHLQGVSLNEAGDFFARMGARVAAAADAFLNAEVAN